MGRLIEFQSGGLPKRGYLAQPRRGPGPGILILHSWWGLNEFFFKLCNRLARQGYSVFAPDFYGGQVPSTADEARELIEALNFLETRSLAVDAVQVLKENSSVASLGTIGFAVGGAWSIFLSCLQPEDFRAAVIFYGSETADYSRSRSAYLGHFALHDELEPIEGVRQMEQNLLNAGREVLFHIYPGTQHWFFEANRPEFHPSAARLAWQRTLRFLSEHLKPREIQKSRSPIFLDKRRGKNKLI